MFHISSVRCKHYVVDKVRVFKINGQDVSEFSIATIGANGVIIAKPDATVEGKWYIFLKDAITPLEVDIDGVMVSEFDCAQFGGKGREIYVKIGHDIFFVSSDDWSASVVFS